jgi:HEAT repeat protein
MRSEKKQQIKSKYKNTYIKANAEKKRNDTINGICLVVMIFLIIFDIAVFEDYIYPWFKEIPFTGFLNYNSTDAINKRDAIFNFADTRNPVYISKVAQCLSDPNPDVRQAAAQALVKFADLRVVPYLVSALSDKDDNVRFVAAKSLACLRRPEAAKYLVDCYFDTNHDNTGKTIDFITLIPWATSSLVAEKLKDENPKVKENAARLMVKLADPDSVELLAKALNDNNPEFRKLIIEALGNTRSPKAIAPLSKCTDDKNAIIAREAVKSLGKLGEASTETLINSLGSKSLIVKNEASNRIAAFGKTGVEILIKKLEQTSDTESKKWIMETLARIGEGQAIKAILKQAESSDKDLSGKAISVIPRFRATYDTDALNAAFLNKNPLIRRAAVENMATMGQETHIPLIFCLTTNKDLVVQRCATGVIALTGIPNKDAKEWLLREYPKNHDISGIENYEAFIIYGIENSEDDLIKLLNQYNDEKMANSFLKCGNEKLQTAAWEWAGKFNGRHKLNPVPEKNDIKWNSL